MSRIGLYGGTFNPPHRGHLHAAKAAIEGLRLDRLLMLPDRTPPHKIMPEGSPTEAQRLAMVRLTAAECPGIEAAELELTLPPPSYTARTAAYMAQIYPGDTLWWIVGSDMLATLHKWYHPETIFRFCRIGALAREQDDREQMEQTADFLRREYGAAIDIVEAPAYPVSSTQIREALLAGETHLPWLADGVEDYIRREGLYRA